jgi:hypothetical protein
MDMDAPFAEKAANFIQLKIDANPEVSREIIEELLQSPIPEIAEFIRGQSQQNVKLLLDDLAEAQQRGEIRQDIKPEFLLYFIHHMIELATDEKLTGMYSSPQALSRELLNLFFYGILPR